MATVWDPNTKTTIDAFLEHKSQEARWREGDTAIPDLRMVLIPADGDKGRACQAYATEACVRAWTKGELCIGDQIRTQASDAEHRTRSSTLSGDGARPRPTYTCSSVHPTTGLFGILERSIEQFVHHETTAGQAHEFVKRIQKEFQSKDSPRWPQEESRVDVHDLEVEKETIPNLHLDAPASFEELEAKIWPLGG